MMRRKGMALVSACLAGERCRYDGTDCLNDEAAAMVAEGVAVSVCPEVLGGLAVPRPAAEIVGGDGRDVLKGRAAVKTAEGADVTGEYIAGAHMAVVLAEAVGCRRALLKSRSPSCGADRIFDGGFSGRIVPGAGVAAAALAEAGLELESID